MTLKQARSIVSAFNRVYKHDKVKAVLHFEIKLVANKTRRRRRAKPKHVPVIA